MNLESTHHSKILFVTGASSEIGLQLVENIGTNYEKIYAQYNNNLDKLKNIINRFGDKVIPIKADLSNEDDLKLITDELNNRDLYPDHFVHLAAEKVNNCQFHKCSWNMYQSSMDINFKSSVILLENIIPQMVKNRYGKIVFVLTSHTLGNTETKYQSPYITSKFALLGLMRNLSSEYSDRGITVNGISPDMVETAFLSNISPKIIEISAKNSPIKRNVTVQEVAAGIAYMLSDDADCISGQNLGITCR